MKKVKSRIQPELSRLIASGMAYKGLEVSELAPAIGMSQSTFYLRRKNLNNMTLGELAKLRKTLGIEREAFLRCIEI